MRIILAGSSGFVGKALKARLHAEGHGVSCLRRLAGSGAGPVWDPQRGKLDYLELENADAVVNLCGAGVADRRWTPKRLVELRESRIAPTRTLVGAMALCSHPPRTFISASAIGYYGNKGEVPVGEEAAPGRGFLAGLCTEWEMQARKAEPTGVRVMPLRIGMVIGPEGGVLARLRPIYRLGLGGPIGMGRRWMSWVSREDLVNIILHLIRHSEITGPVNAVSPVAVRGSEFSNCLGRIFMRPAIFPVPPLLLRLLYGRMGQETLLSSLRVIPNRLKQSGFEFQHPRLEMATRGIS